MLELTTRAANVLKNENIFDTKELARRLRSEPNFLRKVPNCGRVTVEELRCVLKSLASGYRDFVKREYRS